MKLELLDNGCLKILLSDEELSAIGLDLTSEKLQPHTRTALRKLVRTAQAQAGLSPEGSLTLEAIPLEGGCLLLVSPSHTAANQLPTKAVQPNIYRTADFDALLALAQALPKAVYTSLYTYKQQFYLCHYPFCGDQYSDAVIHEFLSPVHGGYRYEAVLSEHGTCLATGDALDRLRLTAPEYHAPEQSDPPH